MDNTKKSRKKCIECARPIKQFDLAIQKYSSHYYKWVYFRFICPDCYIKDFIRVAGTKYLTPKKVKAYFNEIVAEKV